MVPALGAVAGHRVDVGARAQLGGDAGVIGAGMISFEALDAEM